MRQPKNWKKELRMTGYSERLRHVMNRTSISQTALSQKVGVSQAEISNFCRAHSLPRLPLAQKIAFTLDVPYKYLNYGIGTEKHSSQIYRLTEFWDSFTERLCYLLWTRNKSQLEFSKACPDKASAQWFEESRSPSESSLTWCSEYLSSPVEFLIYGWPWDARDSRSINEISDFYIYEYKSLYNEEISYVELD